MGWGKRQKNSWPKDGLIRLSIRKWIQKLMEIAEIENAVITSYTLPWLTENPIKFWLRGSQNNRAKRMANRDNINFLDAKKDSTAEG